ncbi:phage tail protein [Moellerella wisconsensis]|nr:phage tail protein [Moellerella wisconsensis]UNH25097.1 phage tail protein [Moellerella wisconsensis]UNH28206.1 phage tail protein [Moellerella wisconsensis]UNH43322.1 phage tail protein [Moellerella wisconsensis]
MKTFIWAALTEAPADVSFRVRKAQFGDGYTQVSGDGLNNRSQNWSLSFEGTEAEMKPIKDFFDEHEGWKSFIWKPPLEENGLWRCEEYKVIAQAAARFSINATFVQAFNS